MKKLLLVGCMLAAGAVRAQDGGDAPDTVVKRYTVHFQHTLVEQSHLDVPQAAGVDVSNSLRSLSKNADDLQ